MPFSNTIPAAIHLHSDRVSMHNLGVSLGLKGEALDLFGFACCEVILGLSVNTDTGEATIVAVDGRHVSGDKIDEALRYKDEEPC